MPVEKPLEMKRLVATPFFLMSVAMFVAALASPAAYDRGNSVLGMMFFIEGFIGVPMELIGLIGGHGDVLPNVAPWLANPLLLALWLALVVVPRSWAISKLWVGVGLIALCLALAYLLDRSVVLDVSSGYVAKNVTLGVGYYLWIASILCAFWSIVRLNLLASSINFGPSNKTEDIAIQDRIREIDQ